MDRLINSKGKINIDNIHLYGTAAIFMASKYHETDKTLKLDQVVNGIVYGKFDKKKILACEA